MAPVWGPLQLQSLPHAPLASLGLLPLGPPSTVLSPIHRCGHPKVPPFPLRCGSGSWGAVLSFPSCLLFVPLPPPFRISSQHKLADSSRCQRTCCGLLLCGTDPRGFFFFCLFGRDHKQAERQPEGEGEAGSPRSREPDAGLDP
ncbi:unnamed protein product, partial [Gulo gulo]